MQLFLDQPAKGVTDQDMCLLNTRSDVARYDDRHIAKLAERAAIAPKQAYSLNPHSPSHLAGGDNIGRVSGCGDAHQTVAGTTDTFYLTRENVSK